MSSASVTCFARGPSSGAPWLTRWRTSRAAAPPARKLELPLSYALEKVPARFSLRRPSPPWNVHAASLHPYLQNTHWRPGLAIPSSYLSAMVNSTSIPSCIIPLISRSEFTRLAFLVAGSPHPSPSRTRLKPPPPRYSSPCLTVTSGGTRRAPSSQLKHQTSC